MQWVSEGDHQLVNGHGQQCIRAAIVGVFPPSSMSIFRGPAAAAILAAVVGPPVKDTRAMRLSVTSACPAWARPQITATRRAGTPAYQGTVEIESRTPDTAAATSAGEESAT